MQVDETGEWVKLKSKHYLPVKAVVADDSSV